MPTSSIVQRQATSSVVSTSTISLPDESLTSLTTSAIQTASDSAPVLTSGTVITSLETSGETGALPFPTSVTNASTTLSLLDTATLQSVKPTLTQVISTLVANDIFQPIATDSLPSQISQRGDHPVPRLGVQPQQSKLETNKFYVNLMLGSQTAPVFTYPYSVSWSKGGGSVNSWGLSISHIERNQLAYGPAKPGYDAGQWAYFVNPIGIQSMILSATELSTGTTLTTDSAGPFSVNANLLARGASSPTISFPLVQGMPFITALYRSGTPLLQSGVGFQNITYTGTLTGGTTYKYRARLGNGYTWLIYVTPSSTNFAANKFNLINSINIQGPSGFNGMIQTAKLPANAPTDAENIYDSAAGAYSSTAKVSGTVQGSAGSYTISWTKQGASSQQLLMFALPHHIASMTTSTAGGVTDLQMYTTTKGLATAVRGTSWTLQESKLPIDMSFAPWTPTKGSMKSVSAAAAQAINAAGSAELKQDIPAQTNVGSLYYDGKALAKFAAMVYTLHDISGNPSLALTGLKALEQAFALHVNNQMQWPLVYESAWGGVVSSATYTNGDSGLDFGNTYYNDHHFHYGYFVYAAAVIGYLNPLWLGSGSNKAWVNMLVRDYANSVDNDPYFPFSRSFDWYHGHSWASGLFESFDGRNQESSSEDTMASYAVKMWGQVIGDTAMQARGNLMLAIQARSLQSYYLYSSSNAVEPAQWIGNKAAGILFDNKIDHTTYFGDNAEYVEGIHMLPIMPFTTLVRSPDFVNQEWQAYFASTINSITGGWRGLLMANWAIVNPSAAYQFFKTIDISFLDGGASQTWYLAWSAALGGL